MLTKALIIMSLLTTLTTVSLAQDLGTIIGWGSNDGFPDDYNDYKQATPLEGDDFAAIDAGLHHSIALKIDRTIVAWGDNSYGQSSPPEGDDFVAIAAGSNHNVAIHANGSLTSWGDSAWGLESQTPAGNDFIAVSAGALHSLALRSDGTLAAWGVDSGLTRDSDYGQVRETPSGSNFIAVASGTYHTLAISSEPGASAGTIRAWGRNADGQATPPAGNDFVAVAAGFSHSLALRSDGSLDAWGRDDGSVFYDHGQVTDTPDDDGYIAIAAGDHHNIAMKSDGSLVTWGWNNKGQVTGAPREGNFIAVAAGGYHTLTVELNCLYQLWGDLNDDCRVNLTDFHILASAWLSTYFLSDLESMGVNWLTDCRLTPFDPACVPEQDCQYQLQGDFDDNCRVDLSDFYMLASAWLSGYNASDLQTMTDHWLTDCRLSPFDPACIPK